SPLVNEHPDPERERERVNPTIPLRPSFDSSLLRRLHPKCPKFGFLRVASDLCEKVKERKEVVWKVTMASGDVGGGGAEILMMDEAYEFSAPRFFDFINGETEEDIKRAELWFETSLSYAPSRTFLRSGFVIVASVVVRKLRLKHVSLHALAFVPRIREGRSTQIDSLCDFGNVEKEQKVTFCSCFCCILSSVKVSEVERCQNNIVPQQETSFPCNSSTSVAITGSLSDKEVPLELPIALSGGTPAAELETAHRVRAVRIKSSAELEEEMLAKIPKFKARPLNKKIKEKELRYKRLREEQESAKMNIYRSMKQRTKPKSPDLRVNHRVERRHALHMR
ncbi:hypothetical protein BHM03_00036125, partial [Ensete ventricosum]